MVVLSLVPLNRVATPTLILSYSTVKYPPLSPSVSMIGSRLLSLLESGMLFESGRFALADRPKTIELAGACQPHVMDCRVNNSRGTEPWRHSRDPQTCQLFLSRIVG